MLEHLLDAGTSDILAALQTPLPSSLSFTFPRYNAQREFTIIK